VTTSKK